MNNQRDSNRERNEGCDDEAHEPRFIPVAIPERLLRAGEEVMKRVYQRAGKPVPEDDGR